MLYIANCNVNINKYMDHDENYNTNHIVEAKDEDEVYNKIAIYYDCKNIPYYEQYSVNVNYVNQIIT